VSDDSESPENANWQGLALTEYITLPKISLDEFNKCAASRLPFGPVEGTINYSELDSVFVEVRGVPHLDVDGNHIGYRGTITDITPRKVAENRALHLSMHDELTSLRNRRALNIELPNILADAQQELNKVAFVGIDLDGFKGVNDSYGHEAGDNLLISVSRRLEKICNASCHAFRVGGDEFVILVQNLPMDVYIAGREHTDRSKCGRCYFSGRCLRPD